jgi:hypothetical protein
MPNYFQLTRKSNPEAGPVKFVDIDAELCKHFNAPCHPTEWFMGWYDIVGFSLACGRSFESIIKAQEEHLAERSGKGADTDWIKDQEMFIHLCKYLDEHFTSAAWYQPK